MAKIPNETKKKCEPYCPNPSRYSIPIEETRKKIPDIDVENQVCGPLRYAGRTYMDMNGHINNVAYIVWGLDCLPHEMLDSHRLSELEIDFKAECEPGDCIKSCWSESEGAEPDGKTYIHSLYTNKNGKNEEIVRLRSQWLPQY